jgi:hypothetical protein
LEILELAVEDLGRAKEEIEVLLGRIRKECEGAFTDAATRTGMYDRDEG